MDVLKNKCKLSKSNHRYLLESGSCVEDQELCLPAFHLVCFFLEAFSGLHINHGGVYWEEKLWWAADKFTRIMWVELRKWLTQKEQRLCGLKIAIAYKA